MNRKCEFYEMEILLVAATEMEIQPILLLLKQNNHSLSGHNLSLLLTGIGQVNTTYQVLARLQEKNIDLVLQAGIAGSFNPAIDLGQTVLVAKDCFGDLGMEEKGNFTTVFDAGFADKNAFPFTDGWLVNEGSILAKTTMQKVRSVTINKVSDRQVQQQQLQQLFNADIESMEGAALHYVCLQQQIPFLQIRSISNWVGERDKSKWRMKEAIINLNIEIEKLISELP